MKVSLGDLQVCRLLLGRNGSVNVILILNHNGQGFDHLFFTITNKINTYLIHIIGFRECVYHINIPVIYQLIPIDLAANDLFPTVENCLFVSLVNK